MDEKKKHSDCLIHWHNFGKVCGQFCWITSTTIWFPDGKCWLEYVCH